MGGRGWERVGEGGVYSPSNVFIVYSHICTSFSFAHFMTILVTYSTDGELGRAFFMIFNTSTICSLESLPAINI